MGLLGNRGTRRRRRRPRQSARARLGDVFLEIDSNAANFPLLEIGVCGRAIATAADATGDCPNCGAPDSDDLACAPEE